MIPPEYMPPSGQTVLLIISGILSLRDNIPDKFVVLDHSRIPSKTVFTQL